jgi:hypothetical protein
MFSLVRADAWSPSDLALQYAAKDALRLEARPGPTEMVRSPKPGAPGAPLQRGFCGPTTATAASQVRR